MGFQIHYSLRVRLAGINAPEKRGASKVEGMKSKDALSAKIPVGTEFILETVKDSQEKYGRYLATVFLGEENINQWLVNQGLVVYVAY